MISTTKYFITFEKNHDNLDRNVTKGAGGINGACGGINSGESGTVGNDGAAPLISGESAITTCAVVLNVSEVFLLSLTP